jgi:YD repeat-containing protein
MSLSIDPSKNQVTTSGFAYDANGNTTSIPNSSGTTTLSYDIANRTGGTWYDQQNQALDRAGVWNLYGLRGERLATYTYTVNQQPNQEGSITYIFETAPMTQASRNVYFGGRLIQSNGTTVVTDRQGSVRTNEAGGCVEILSVRGGSE